ncbi:hypothetical protein [Roseomonas xinghualingensis]|uniref:hypothetical protein n=1 Tax=Roseomonas xinghualingensis TaxID=2986475 RepID=UPI0021F1C1C5|nr:hypothetical protein [Roseomonas sp. SXEYE001]MCV4207154.1 hypothetical protein [Roseomonas sp. SXEYE001]
MSYVVSNLVPLVAADSFTLWLYKTTDSRATVLAPGYFATAASRLLPGHLLVLQAGDASAILPVRAGGAVGNGLVLDATSPPLRLPAAGSLDFSADLAASAAARCLTLGAMPNGVNQGETFSVQASASGAVTTLKFSILNAAGAVVLGPVSATVTAGSASATFTAPSPGSGYRLKVEDEADSLVMQISPSFVVLSAFALLIESGTNLLLETGGRLIL